MRAAGGWATIGETKSQAQNWHQKVLKYFKDGQAAHDRMYSLMEEAGKLRDRAQECHNQFLVCRRVVDSEHEKHIAAIRRMKRVKDKPPYP